MVRQAYFKMQKNKIFKNFLPKKIDSSPHSNTSGFSFKCCLLEPAKWWYVCFCTVVFAVQQISVWLHMSSNQSNESHMSWTSARRDLSSIVIDFAAL